MNTRIPNVKERITNVTYNPKNIEKMHTFYEIAATFMGMI